MIPVVLSARRAAAGVVVLAIVAAGCSAPSPASPAPASAGASASVSASVSPAAGLVEGCTAPARATVAQTEGPYYSAGAPASADLVTDDMPGTRLTLTGFVVDTACRPVAGARVETWQADALGVYDNEGYRLRGWVTTDASGRYSIRTIVPGEYPGRTEHIHVKITPPGGETLTTQLYFPGATGNDGDGIFDASLELAIAEDGDALAGGYTFVVQP